MTSRTRILCMGMPLLGYTRPHAPTQDVPDRFADPFHARLLAPGADGDPLPAGRHVRDRDPTTIGAQTATPAEPTLTSTPYLTPTETPLGATPSAAAAIQLPDGEVTILLMGSDQRPGAPDFHTDTLLLVVLRPDGSISLVSFPRDLWIYLPDRFMQRINTAQEFGGFQLVQKTFLYNFGFAPQSYILTNFSGFQSIVDSLGGVDTRVGQTLSDTRSGYPDGFTVSPGLVHMDGATTLWYVRSRKTTSDLDRLGRAQEVISAVGSKLASQGGLAHLPQIYAAFRGAIVTDLTLQDVTGLLPLLQQADPDRVQRYAIGIDQLLPFITSNGADVLLPRPGAIRQMLLQALGGW